MLEVTRYPSLPRNSLSVVMNSVSFDSQKYLGLDNKLYYHWSFSAKCDLPYLIHNMKKENCCYHLLSAHHVLVALHIDLINSYNCLVTRL